MEIDAGLESKTPEIGLDDEVLVCARDWTQPLPHSLMPSASSLSEFFF
jgi:hypothetical protein